MTDKSEWKQVLIMLIRYLLFMDINFYREIKIYIEESKIWFQQDLSSSSKVNIVYKISVSRLYK